MNNWKQLSNLKKIAYFPTHSEEALRMAHAQRASALSKEIRAAKETSQDIAKKVDVAASSSKAVGRRVADVAESMGSHAPDLVRDVAGKMIPPTLGKDLKTLGSTAVDTASSSVKSVLEDNVPVGPIATGAKKVLDATKGHFEDPHNTMYYHNLQRTLAAKAEALAGNPVPLAQETIHQYGEKPTKAIVEAVSKIKDKMKKKAGIFYLVKTAVVPTDLKQQRRLLEEMITAERKGLPAFKSYGSKPRFINDLVNGSIHPGITGNGPGAHFSTTPYNLGSHYKGYEGNLGFIKHYGNRKSLPEYVVRPHSNPHFNRTYDNQIETALKDPTILSPKDSVMLRKRKNLDPYFEKQIRDKHLRVIDSENFNKVKKKLRAHGSSYDTHGEEYMAKPRGDYRFGVVKEGPEYAELAKQKGLSRSSERPFTIEQLIEKDKKTPFKEYTDNFINSKFDKERSIGRIKNHSYPLDKVRFSDEGTKHVFVGNNRVSTKGLYKGQQMGNSNKTAGIFDGISKKSEILRGGKADNKPDSNFSEDQIRKGIKTESEHTKSKALAKEIAKDHLTEDPKYYDHLKKMEAKYNKKEACYGALAWFMSVW